MVICLLVALAGSTPLTSTATMTADPAQARAAFETGMRYFRAGEHRAALPYFQESVDRSLRRPSALRALAQCERTLQLYPEAIRHFEEYLGTRPVPEDAESIRATITFLQRLSADRGPAESSPGPATEPPPDPEVPSVGELGGSPSPGPEIVGPSAVSLPAPPLAAPAPVAAPPEASGAWLNSPYLWAAIGFVAAGAAVSVALILGGGEPEVYRGSTGVVLSRLQAPF